MSDDDRRQAGADALGQRAEHGLHPLLHELPGAVDVRAPGELGEDERERHVGVRAQPVESADALHRAFERLRDERLDFLRREAGRFGENGDRRLRHVRQHLDRQLPRQSGSRRRAAAARADDDGAVVQREADELVQHGLVLRLRCRWLLRLGFRGRRFIVRFFPRPSIATTSSTSSRPFPAREN